MRLWHLTSLDAPTVAVVWTLAVAWAAGVSLPVWIPWLLALAAWAVYVGDRLLDARTATCRGELARLQERHHFHHRHRRVLAPLAIAAACAAACLVFTLMPAAARERNSVLAVAALAYFSGIHGTTAASTRGSACRRLLKRVLRKEMLVGLLFTAACALPALSRAGNARLLLSFAAIVFALLAWLNCYAIDRWETADSGQFAHISGLAGALTVAAVLGTASVAATHPRIAELLLAAAASALLLGLLHRQRRRLTPLALRAAADFVLLTPLALLLR